MVWLPVIMGTSGLPMMVAKHGHQMFRLEINFYILLLSGTKIQLGFVVLLKWSIKPPMEELTGIPHTMETGKKLFTGSPLPITTQDLYVVDQVVLF